MKGTNLNRFLMDLEFAGLKKFISIILKVFNFGIYMFFRFNILN